MPDLSCHLAGPAGVRLASGGMPARTRDPLCSGATALTVGSPAGVAAPRGVPLSWPTASLRHGRLDRVRKRPHRRAPRMFCPYQGGFLSYPGRLARRARGKGRYPPSGPVRRTANSGLAGGACPAIVGGGRQAAGSHICSILSTTGEWKESLAANDCDRDSFACLAAPGIRHLVTRGHSWRVDPQREATYAHLELVSATTVQRFDVTLRRCSSRQL